MKAKHFLRIIDLSREEIKTVLALAAKLKQGLESGRPRPLLAGKTLAMIFEKPSLRIRLSFEIGMTQLGGHAVYLGPADIQIGKRETPEDIGRVASSMADLLMARTFKHRSLERLAGRSSAPVINGLSELEHPCQALADYLTIKEVFGKVEGLVVAYVGDGNNVTHSLALLSAMLGNEFRCASPEGYWMKRSVVAKARQLARVRGSMIKESDNPALTVEGADVVVTDTWVSMGSEAEKTQRLKAFRPYQVNRALMKLASKSAIFLHCLPAYRGKEVTAAVIDGPQSAVYQEAENRLHAQKALLVHLWQNWFQ